MKVTKRSEFSKDIDELMDEYVPTEHKFNGAHMHIPTKGHRGVDIESGPVSAGALIYDKETGAVSLYDGKNWVTLPGISNKK